MKRLLFILLASAFFFNGKGQSVDLNFPEPNNQTYAVLYDSVRNSVYIGGEFTIVGSSVRSHFACLNSSTGAIQTWNPSFNAAVFNLIAVGDYLYATGTFTTVSGSPRNHMAKFDLRTQTLTSWNPAVSGIVTSIAYDNGQIYAGNNNGQLYRIDTANTATIDTWQPVNDGYINDLMVANGFLYVAGAYATMDGQPRGNISAFDLSTSSPTLDAWAPDADNRCNNLAYYNGNVYVSGFFTSIASSATAYLAELTEAPMGAASVTSWNPGATTEIHRLRVKGNQLYYFNYPNPLQEIYLPTHTPTTWSVTFGANIGWDTYGFDLSATQMFFGGGWNLTVQGASRKNFAVLCARPYSPIINSISIVTAPSTICHGQSNVLFEVSTGSGATSYSWTSSPAATVSSNADSANITFSSGGTTSQYTISVNGSNGCLSTNTASTAVGTYTLGASLSSLLQGSMICGDVDTLSVNGNNYQGSGAVNYTWAPSSSLNTNSGDTVFSHAKSTVVYTVTTTSSDGCVGKDSITLNVTPFNVNLSHSSQNILCSEKDTMSVTTDYPGTGTISYTWSPGSNLNLSNPVKVIASPVTSTVYTLDANSSDGCAASQQIVPVNVTALTVIASASSTTITCGNSTNLNTATDYPGNGTVTYTWAPGGDLSNISIGNPVASPTNAATFQVDISTPEGCQSSGSVFVNVDPLQINTSGSYNSTCGNAVTLITSNNSGNSNLTYSWSPATGLSSPTASSPQANVGATTIFTVTMSLPGCSDALAYDTVKIAAPLAPTICEISSDSLSQYNIIYWDKTGYQSTDSFIVYRETITNVYTRIAAIPYTAMSMYTDTARSIGPANGDPNVGSYRYKLAVKDSCGNVSVKSPYHTTVFFIDTHTGAFTWNLYAVENAATPVTQFNLLRDDANTGMWHVIGVVTGNNNTLNDPNYSSYQSIANWRVEALGFNCTPTARYGNNSTEGSVVKSKSNITNNRQIGVKTNAESLVSIYPNPSNGKFEIDLSGIAGNVSVKIFSLLGEEIFRAEGKEKIPVDLGKDESGTYLVQLITNSGIITKRIIKN